ncbi:Maf family protein [Mariluticola halotolerans]|uniref:Maf family protein n=1 Tax=Mariluticola halotolerans TaxID=2909283 RepID=UPI0026E178E1|nr:Maf family protein [Mariluticola halotolerans]UJQ93542.1 Maf family protein [Mariluticola halotolerans]
MLILASTSSARRQLLTQAGLGFSVYPAEIDERAVTAGIAGDEGEIARYLAGAKAEAVSRQFPRAFVIGADQTLALDGAAFHKPANLAGAQQQLSRLRGRTHQLFAGVALARAGRVIWDHLATAALTMRDFTDEERDRVLALEGEEILSSVGSYRLEGPSVQLFERIEGDYFTILGLPLLPLLAGLRQHAPDLFEKTS